jgi:transcriptional regulator with XRE-family HTH domain
MDQTTAPFGRLLKNARSAQRISQMELALAAEVSARHLSWLETGKAQPSRAMVLRLAEHLEVPLRERNAWLQAAGFAPLYGQRAWADPSLAAARESLQRVLDAHEPWPALAVDRHWNLLAHNRLIPVLLAHVAPSLLATPLNVLRLSLHQEGLAPMIDNLAEWRAYVLGRLQRQVGATGDASLAALLQELRAMSAPADATRTGATQVTAPASNGEQTDPPTTDIAVPLRLNTPYGRLNFVTMVSVFGAPRDVTLSEIAIETLLPADAATAQALKALHEAQLREA